MKSGWQRVQDDRDRKTDRLEVPGGWLYLVTEKGEIGLTILNQMLAFVPRASRRSERTDQ